VIVTEIALRSLNGANVQMHKHVVGTLRPNVCPPRLIRFSAKAKVTTSSVPDSRRRTIAIAEEIVRETRSIVPVTKGRPVVQMQHL